MSKFTDIKGLPFKPVPEGFVRVGKGYRQSEDKRQTIKDELRAREEGNTALARGIVLANPEIYEVEDGVR